MEKDYGRWMVWFLSEMKGGPLPPYILEIVMKDGRSFYVHSGNSRDEETQSVVVNVWDLRTVDTNAELEIKKILDNAALWGDLKTKLAKQIHPSLGTGMLRCRLEDISYVAQWDPRVWDIENLFPKETARKIGFVLPPQEES